MAGEMSSPFLTIPRARSMIWPGSQQTMGELLDQDKLTCKMLRRASAKAENEQVRMAAEVLLVDRERKIREYIDSGNLPRNIDEAVAVKVTDNGGWATIRELWYRHNGCMDWNRLQSLVIGAVLGFCVAYLLWYAYKAFFVYDYSSLADLNWLAWVIIGVGAVLMLVACYFVIIRPLDKIINYLDSKIASFKKGVEGEDHVVDALRESLDGSCHIFRNLHFNGRKEDIDIVLISPWGVFAIEVKNRSGTFEYSGSDFYEKRKGGYEKVADDSNPIKQARRNAAALKEFLDPDFNRNKEHAFVEPIVVWANPEIKVYRKKPADSQDPHSQETKCWRIEDLSFELDSIRCKKHLSEKAQREIIKKLESCY